MKLIDIGNLSQNNVLIVWIEVIVGRTEAGHQDPEEKHGDRRVSTGLRQARYSDRNERQI